MTNTKKLIETYFYRLILDLSSPKAEITIIFSFLLHLKKLKSEIQGELSRIFINQGQKIDEFLLIKKVSRALIKKKGIYQFST